MDQERSTKQEVPAVQFVFTQSMLGLICVWKNFLVCFIILRCYEVASVHSLPQCVSGCWELLHSEAFFLLLSNFTGLRLHFLCPADDDEEETEGNIGDKKATVSANGSESSNTSQEKGCCQF